MEAAPPPPPPVAAWEADGGPGGPRVETQWEGGEASQPGAAPSQAGGLEAHWEACWARLVPRLSTLPDQPACLPQLAEELHGCFGPLRLVFAHYVKHAAAVPAATSPQEGRLHAALDRRGRGGGGVGVGVAVGCGGGGGGGGVVAAAHAMSWAQLQGFAQSVTLLRKSFDLHNLASLSAMLVGTQPEATREPAPNPTPHPSTSPSP